MSAPLHLIPDAPITSPSFDRLDRMSFVRSFAEAIRAVHGNDSVVLALAGPWGSGKSSLLNLVAGELEAGETPPLIMRFNPWWFSGTNRLVAAFLQQLGAAVSRPPVRETLGNATGPLERLGEIIARPGTRPPAEDPGERDMERMRQEVNACFSRSDRRILVFMDDIDRLTPDEMTQLLLIVRAVADFPNTTYVLAFDYEVVVEAIGSKLGVDGRTYLEKVVQLQIDVPLPGRKTLERLVIGQLEAIDPDARSLDHDAQKQFRILFERGIKHFLATPRACTRLLNVLRFTYPTLAGQIYFPDMLGICCLMSFSSQAIQAIRSYSDAFVGHCDPSGKGWLNTCAFHHAWLAELPKRDRLAVEAIVRLLFPKVAWALNGPLRGEEYLEIWERQNRICTPKHFDAYFRLGLSAGEAAEYQWQNVVELLDDATAFARALERFGPIEAEQGSDWVGELLQQAADFVNERASSAQARDVFRAIMRRGDLIAAVRDEEPGGFLKIEPIHAVVSVLLDCLLRIEAPRQRLETLSDSVAEDAGLLTAAELLDLLNYRIDIFAQGEEVPSAEANAARLLQVLRVLDSRIQEACRSGELARHPQFMKIVQKWWQFGRKSKAAAWVRHTCQDDAELVSAVMQLRAGLSGEPGRKGPLELLANLFGRRELRDRIRKLLAAAPAWLTTQQSETLRQLAELLEESE